MDCPRNSPGQNTGVGSLSLFQGNLPNPGIKPRSPTLQADSLPAEPQGNPKDTWVCSLSLLQQIFLTQELKPGLLHCRQIFFTNWAIREAHDKPRQHIKKRDISLPTKVCLVKDMVFPVVMYGCESWTIKKAEHRRTHAFKLWCWRRLLRVPWTTGRSNQSILKEISPEYLLEGLMLKLKLQYYGHLMRRTSS